MRGYDLCRSRASPRVFDCEGLRGGYHQGFTLIEVILVIVVLGILAFIVSLNLSSLDTIKLNNGVEKVVGDLRYAQQLAMTTRSRHGVTVDAVLQRRYSVHEDCGVDGICGNTDDTAQVAGVDTLIQDPTNLGQNFQVDFDTYQQGQLQGVQFNSLTPFCPAGCGACQREVEFNSVGAPTTTAGVPYACNLTVVLTKTGAPNQTITIEQNTGRMSR